MTLNANTNQVTKTVLLIDDESYVRKTLNDLLMNAYGDSILVIEGDSAEAAHNIILNFHIDFVICDFDLQYSSGLTVYSYFKKYKKEPKFIFFTSALKLERFLPKLDSFYLGIIGKPDFDEVVKIVGVWLLETKTFG